MDNPLVRMTNVITDKTTPENNFQVHTEKKMMQNFESGCLTLTYVS